MAFLRKLWTAWKAFALWLGRVQTVVLLSIVYHLTIGPTGLIARLFRRDFLHLRRPKDSASCWVALSETTTTLERAQKQF